MVSVKYDKSSFIILQGEEKDIRVNEGDTISFTAEASGEIITGVTTKICGSKKERLLQILPVQSECEQLWSVFSIAENSLNVIKRVNEFDEDEENMEDEE